MNPFGNQLAYPIMQLNSNDLLELHFDDLEGGYKNYYYAFELCNADWTPVLLSQFDYVNGYSQLQITNYRLSNSSLTRYTHYSITLPDRNMSPSRSGNYILRVYENADTSKTILTKRFLVVDKKADVSTQIVQPFTQSSFYTHQKLNIMVNIRELPVNIPNMQLKVVVLQNGRWDNARYYGMPTFMRGKNYEYSSESDNIFSSGKEWRWADLRSLRFRTDRVASIEAAGNLTTLRLKADEQRSDKSYLFFRDDNGRYMVDNTDGMNPYWQSDYANVVFSYGTPNLQPYLNQDMYIFGELTNYEIRDEFKMVYDNESGFYKDSIMLKQGYYNYAYVLVDRSDKKKIPDMSVTEGNFYDTENEYTILVYYKDLGGRADQLVSATTASTLFGRSGGIRIGN